MRKAYTELMQRQLISSEARDDLVQHMKDDTKKLEVEYPSSSDESEPEKKRQRIKEQSSEVESGCRLSLNIGSQESRLM